MSTFVEVFYINTAEVWSQEVKLYLGSNVCSPCFGRYHLVSEANTCGGRDGDGRLRSLESRLSRFFL